MLPTALGGIVTGTTLAVARAAGETAPLLFTCSIFGQTVSTDPSHAVASIPVIIFQYSESPDKHLNAQAWAAAFLLIVFVLVTSLLARFFLDRSRRKLGGALSYLRPFTTPSPASSHAGSPPGGRRWQPGAEHGKPQHKERKYMKKKGLSLLIAALPCSPCPSRARSTRHSSTTLGRRQHVRLAARLHVDARARERVRLHDAVQPDRLRRRHPGDHEPHVDFGASTLR